MLRHDLTTDSWVLLAPSRAMRPRDTAVPPAGPPGAAGAATRCPFCPGNEEETPPEVFALRDESGWRVRVVPNRYPAIEGSGEPAAAVGAEPFLSFPGIGAHEVIVESPHHDRELYEQPAAHVAEVLRVLQSRQQIHETDERIQAVTVFRNQGRAAGASLSHPHWQLLSAPVVPPHLARRDGVAQRYFTAHGRPLLADLVDAERRASERIVEESEEWVALVPFGARFPYETWLVPKRPAASLLDLDAVSIDALSVLLPRTLSRYRAVLGKFDYNVVSITAPGCARRERHFGYHLQVLPRLASPAGFELGSGMWINSKLPEDAARELRNARAAS